MSKEVDTKYANRNEANVDLKKIHMPVFKALGTEEDPLFLVKTFHGPKGVPRAQVKDVFAKFFDTELKLGRDIFTESVKLTSFIPEDPKRTLYKLPYREDWRTIYDEIEENIYSIPLSKLVKVGINGQMLTEALPIQDYALQPKKAVDNLEMQVIDMRVVKSDDISTASIILKHMNALTLELSELINKSKAK